MNRILPAIILLSFFLVVASWTAEAKIVSVSASTCVLALNDDGTVWAWGDNSYGRLGIGTTGGSYATPQKVLIDNVAAISVGGSNSYALKNDGTVWAWGYGEYGRLGYGGNESQSKPVPVKNLTDIIAISAANEDCYALKSDGTVWAWGDNRGGEIGDGTYGSPAFVSSPVQVKGLFGIKALGKGDMGSYAIKDDGTLYAWGDNTITRSGENDILSGALGDNSGPVIKPVPFPVKGVSDVKQIAGGRFNSAYIKSDGTVWAWGVNQFGAVGDGTIDDSRPVVRTPSVQLKLSDIIDVSTMNYHSLALKNDGTVWAWGMYIDRKGTMDNAGLPSNGQSGEPSPVLVSNIDNIVDISAGFDCDIVLKDDGTVWGWGRNDHGELGDHKIVEPYPVLIFKGPPQATSVPSVVASAASSATTQLPAGTPTPTAGASAVPVSTGGFQTLLMIVSFVVACGLILSKGKIK